jgi:hypothetical protein
MRENAWYSCFFDGYGFAENALGFNDTHCQNDPGLHEVRDSSRAFT